jgi:chromosome segregation protein
MLIQEVILENFMSYVYARVPFKSGVNIICGPNGSGKSSLLLAISVGLGQSYTERSKKLSNLIRWGKDQARVTLILDNKRKAGKRPVPRLKKDQIFLTRVLRKDGKYWFELENSAASKSKVQRLLSKLGVDPDNMLIIMHQNMVEQFTVLSIQEKLRIVEAAVGLVGYRENVLQAQKKLTRILSQEESTGKLFESAEQTLNYWREQYTKYQEKKQLLTKRRFLERELVWAEVERREKIVKELETDIEKELNHFDKIEKEIKQRLEDLSIYKNQIKKLKDQWKIVFDERINLECEKIRNKSIISFSEQLLRETTVLENSFLGNDNPSALLKDEVHPTQFKLLRSKNLQKLITDSNQLLEKLDYQIHENKLVMQKVEDEDENINNTFLESKIHLALLQYKKEKKKANLNKFKKKLKDSKESLYQATKDAEESGSRIAVIKNIEELLDEIRITDGHLTALSDVSEEIERMYESYSKLYLELKEKARLVSENREKTLQEVKVRLQSWRNVIHSLLNRVNLEYEKILLEAQAVGKVRLVNEDDVEDAGLELLVGFKGGQMVPLNAYTQSGGERTLSTMSFLLALQQHVRSPFRAVDEYDIHMDPKNRELIAKMLVSTLKTANSQYIVITPSQVTFAEEEANIIVVQNVEGRSAIREVL